MRADCGFALRIPPACREVARNLNCVRFQTSAVVGLPFVVREDERG